MKFNTKLSTLAVFAVLSATTAGAAFAGDITIDTTPFVPSLTRAQVQAQLEQYQASGVNPWSTRYNQLARFSGTRTRAQVTQEFVQARDEVAALNREDSGSAYLAAHTARAVPAFATAQADVQ
jgi:hypothetical protein